MTTAVVPFISAHLDLIDLHETMSFMNGRMGNGYGEGLASYPSYSYISNSKVLACAGVFPLGTYRYQAWALMSKDSGQSMVGITKEVKKFLGMFEGKRVETHVLYGFDAGEKWMKMLGFKKETSEPMRKYGDDGKDYYLYARVK